MQSIREEITSQIVAQIERGTAPWRRGWSSSEPPRNAKTGQAYRGVNFFLLQSASQYADPRWLTFKQAEAMGVKIKKGSKGYRVVKMLEMDRNQAGAEQDGEVLAEDKGKALVMRGYIVFNAEQVDGLPALPRPTTDKVEPVAAVDAVIEGMKGTGLTIQYGGGQPAYAPLSDTVRMPMPDRFFSTQEMAATVLHEICHASGHTSRLNRLNLYARFGSEEYAKEELRSELGSAFLGAQLGVPLAASMMESHASYLASWLNVLKQDKNEIFKAAADAQKIADYLGQWSPKPLPTAEPAVSGVGLRADSELTAASSARARAPHP